MFKFNLISKVSSLLGNELTKDIRVQSSKNFLSNIESAKLKIEEVQEKKIDIYQEHLKKAVDLLSNFNTVNEIKDAIKILLDTLEINHAHGEPYFLLAYSSRILGNVELSVKYLCIAEHLNPDIDGINELKESITEYILRNKKDEKIIPVTDKKQIHKKIPI